VVLSQLTTLVSAAALLFWLRPTAEIAMIAVLLGLLAALLTSGLFFKDRFQLPKGEIDLFSKIGGALNLGIRGQLGNVATFFNYRLDVFVVNYYLGTTEVGLYALGVVISEALWQVPNAAALALVPRTARNLDEATGSFTCLVCRQVFALVCLSATLLAAASHWLIPLVFGARFGPSVAVIWLILPGTVALAVSKVMCADLLARGMPEYSSIFAFVALIVTVTLDFLLIPRMGIQGAALASSAAYLVNSVAIAFILKRKLGVPWRALYVPSLEELASYKQVWTGLTTWLRPYAAE
jgi:O-antigen/teichoic acid export membrane protein